MIGGRIAFGHPIPTVSMEREESVLRLSLRFGLAPCAAVFNNESGSS
jgi:hypothetical protein